MINRIMTNRFLKPIRCAADYHNHGDWYNGLTREKIEGYTTMRGRISYR
jgi:hypothetical protein